MYVQSSGAALACFSSPDMSRRCTARARASLFSSESHRDANRRGKGVAFARSERRSVVCVCVRACVREASPSLAHPPGVTAPSPFVSARPLCAGKSSQGSLKDHTLRTHSESPCCWGCTAWQPTTMSSTPLHLFSRGCASPCSVWPEPRASHSAGHLPSCAVFFVERLPTAVVQSAVLPPQCLASPPRSHR